MPSVWAVCTQMGVEVAVECKNVRARTSVLASGLVSEMSANFSYRIRPFPAVSDQN